MNKITLLLLTSLITIFNLYAQEKVKLYGKVRGVDGKPVAGASVWLKNKINGLSETNKKIFFTKYSPIKFRIPD